MEPMTFSHQIKRQMKLKNGISSKQLYFKK